MSEYLFSVTPIHVDFHNAVKIRLQKQFNETFVCLRMVFLNAENDEICTIDSFTSAQTIEIERLPDYHNEKSKPETPMGTNSVPIPEGDDDTIPF